MALANAGKARPRRTAKTISVTDSKGLPRDSPPNLFSNLWVEEVPEIQTISDVISSLSAIAIEVLKERETNPESAKESRNIVIQGNMGPAICIKIIPDWSSPCGCGRIHYTTEGEAGSITCCDPLGFVRPGLAATLVKIKEETWLCQIYIEGVLAEYKFWDVNQGHVVTGILEASTPSNPPLPVQHLAKPPDFTSLPKQMPSPPPTKRIARSLWPFPRPRIDAKYPELEKAVDNAIFMFMLLGIVEEDVMALPYSEAHEQALQNVMHHFLIAKEKAIATCKQIKENKKRASRKSGKICPRCGGMRKTRHQATSG